MKHRTLISTARVTTVLLAAALLAACGSSSKAGTKSGVQAVLKVAIGTPITTFDEDAANSNLDAWEGLQLVADSLYKQLPSGEVVPDIASSATHSADGLQWTFKLRPDAVFSNGKQVTSQDVKFTFQNEAKQPLAGNDYSEITNIATPDAHTVVFTTKAPDVTFLDKVESYSVAIIPNNFGGESASSFWQKPIGCGAYVISQFVPGVHVEFQKNPKYFDAARAIPTKITFVPVTDTNTASAMLENGSVNAVAEVQSNQVSALKSQNGISLEQTDGGYVYYLILNTKTKGLDNRDVRRAISMAIDRKSLVNSGLLGLGTPGGSFVAAVDLGDWLPTFGTTYDLAQAKSLMAQTPYATSGLTLKFVYDNSNTFKTTAAQAIKAALEPLNIHVNLVGEPHAPATDDTHHDRMDMGLGASLYNLDPGYMIAYYLATRDGFQSQSSNVTQVKSMLSMAEATFDDNQRMTIYHNIATLVANDANIIGLAQPNTYFATGRGIAHIPAGAGNIYWAQTTFK